MTLIRPRPAAPDALAAGFNDPAYPGEAFLDLIIREHRAHDLPRLHRLWDYYRNPMAERHPDSALARGYRMAQEAGLPPRLRRHHAPGPAGESHECEREVVIENDIAWRIHALVDFMFGRPPVLQSLAPDPARASLIERFLRRVFHLNGDIVFFQNLALLGSVYGYVDVLLRFDAGRILPSAPADPLRFADRFVLETLEAPRIIPVLHPGDYRRLDAWVLHYRQPLNTIADERALLDRLRDRARGRAGGAAGRAARDCTEVYTADTIARYHASADSSSTARPRRLVRRTLNPLGVIPVVHMQNLPQPFMYEGLSEVEPLIALQDELNTRLSDRANRITFQSFRMYLGKGIEGFTERPVGPGQMWSTDNTEAAIQEFGGDGHAPSETAHIAEIRQALDKTSSVTPVAAGMLQGKVGNLTSENALRMTMLGLLARTEKKRVTYGDGAAAVVQAHPPRGGPRQHPAQPPG